MSIHDEIQELLPAYVLDAIDDADRARVERHLPQCDVCARVADAYRPVAELLPFAATPVEPPADLKYRVLATTMPKTRPAPAPSFMVQLSSAFSNFFRSPAFAAITFLLVVALGLWNVSLQNQIAQQAALNQQALSEVTRQRALVSMIAYADSQPKRLQATQVASRAVGRLYTAPELNALALIIYDMPPLPQGKVYQLWLIDSGDNRTSGGTFTVDAQGRAWLLIRAPKTLDNYQGVGITIEPEGGSPAPTGDKMMGTSL
jgi:anti-sigma-K factor RskA